MSLKIMRAYIMYTPRLYDMKKVITGIQELFRTLLVGLNSKFKVLFFQYNYDLLIKPP